MIQLTKASEDWMRQLPQQAFDRVVDLLAACEWDAPAYPTSFSKGFRHIIECGYDKHNIMLTYDSERRLLGYRFA